MGFVRRQRWWYGLPEVLAVLVNIPRRRVAGIWHSVVRGMTVEERSAKIKYPCHTP